MKVIVINGPNLNLLGQREPEIYGNYSLEKLELELASAAKKMEIEIECFQSNSEEKILNFIHAQSGKADWLIINPAALTHTSIALRDAILGTKIKTIEVHISNIFSREEFRHKSYISDIATGIISGLGMKGYFLALDFIKDK